MFIIGKPDGGQAVVKNFDIKAPAIAGRIEPKSRVGPDDTLRIATKAVQPTRDDGNHVGLTQTPATTADQFADEITRCKVVIQNDIGVRTGDQQLAGARDGQAGRVAVALLPKPDEVTQKISILQVNRDHAIPILV